MSLLTASIASKLSFFVLFVLAAVSPPFDSSPALLLSSNSTALPFLRWDVFHYLHIATHGYKYEHEWAFLPGVPFLMRAAAALLSNVAAIQPMPALLLGGVLCAVVCDTTLTLYNLTLQLLGSKDLALLSAVLSLMPSSPATLYFSPYSEPFFTFLSYRGMLYSARHQWLRAAIMFMLAGFFRSNGIMLSGFILWGMLVQPFLDRQIPTVRTTSYATFLTALVFAPFVYHNSSAYVSFCLGDKSAPPLFCDSFPPSVYTYVQAKYWNIGLFRYWTIQQLPNFIIAAPPLMSIYTFSIYHLYNAFIPRISSKTVQSDSLFLNLSLTPYAIHAFLFATILLFASHTQIVLRLAASLPLTYWASAWLLIVYPFYGRCWVAWSIIWGCISIPLWASFLPPA